MLAKLYAGTAKGAISALEKIYGEQGYCIANFLYFANAVEYRLFEDPRDDDDKAYKEALIKSDILFPDGIALQVRDALYHKPRRWLHNLNGTDLTPQILDYFSANYTVHLYISSLYDEKIGKGKQWLEKAAYICKERFGIDTIFAHQTHYHERGEYFPWHKRENHTKSPEVIRIFLNCLGTPCQEVWTQKHRKRFQDNNMLVLNVGGFIDFLTGFEKRAPKRVVKLRVLETFWRIATNPKKNLKKFMAMFGVVRLLRKGKK